MKIAINRKFEKNYFETKGIRFPFVCQNNLLTVFIKYK